MKRIFFYAFLAVALVACGDDAQQESTVRSVVLTTPTPTGTAEVKSYSGVVREAHAINLGFKTAGQIERIYVEEGDYVRKGQRLAMLDTADYHLAVEALQIQYNQRRDEVERKTRLYESKSVSANEYEKAVADLKQLEVQLQTNKNKLDYTTLVAPTDGYVSAVNFSAAEMVDAGTAVFAFLDVSRMEITADIPVSEYLRRNRFSAYSCTAEGMSEACPLKLLSVSPKADGNQLYQLRFTFAARPENLPTSGMNVEVDITVDNSDAASSVSVPLCAVFYTADEPCVWVCRGDSVVGQRRVTIGGIDAEGRAIVTEGLSADEQIVRAGVSVLSDGERVKVVGKSSETNVGDLL